MSQKLSYRVGTFREAGLEAKWSKTRSGQPYIVVRDPEAKQAHMRNRWWICDKHMVHTMEQEGIKDGFCAHTILGDIFSI